MKTAAEWATIMHERSIADKLGWTETFMETIPPIIDQIVAEARNNLPPLPMLYHTPESLDAGLEGVNSFHERLVKRKQAPISDETLHGLVMFIRSLIGDVKTLMRMLGDCEELDAYAKGHAAGCLAVESRHTKVLESIMRISNSRDVCDIAIEAIREIKDI